MMETISPFILQLVPVLIGIVIAVLATRFGIKVPDHIAATVKSAAVTAARGALAKHLRNGSKGDMDGAVRKATADAAEYVSTQLPSAVKKLGMSPSDVMNLAKGVAEEAAFDVGNRKEGGDS